MWFCCFPTSWCCMACIPQQSIGVVERWGKYSRLAQPGFNCIVPCFGSALSGLVSLRVQQLDVNCDTKTKDNVFVTLTCSVQYRVEKTTVYDAFYQLQNPRQQIQAYVFDVVRSSVPRLILDDVFEQKDDIARNVAAELGKVMSTYGYSIQQTLIVDIAPDHTVRHAMNEINAAQRMRMAAQEKAEADKILMVKRAEAEAESKYLSGLGVARQRQAIVDGLRESVLTFSSNVEGTSAREVLDMVLVTQYFDTMRDIGSHGKSTTVFLPHGPGHVADIAEQIRNGQLQANVKTD